MGGWQRGPGTMLMDVWVDWDPGTALPGLFAIMNVRFRCVYHGFGSAAVEATCTPPKHTEAATPHGEGIHPKRWKAERCTASSPTSSRPRSRQTRFRSIRHFYPRPPSPAIRRCDSREASSALRVCTPLPSAVSVPPLNLNRACQEKNLPAIARGALGTPQPIPGGAHSWRGMEAAVVPQPNKGRLGYGNAVNGTVLCLPPGS